MTELLFRDDAYLRKTTARVVAIHERGIELDRTIFYPLGGGQPGDTGSFARADGERGCRSSTPARERTVRTCCTFPSAGRRCRRSASRSSSRSTGTARYCLMRLHTALHVMSCVVVAPVTGGNIAPGQGPTRFRHRHEPARCRRRSSARPMR